jgi:hypothetical protein
MFESFAGDTAFNTDFSSAPQAIPSVSTALQFPSYIMGADNHNIGNDSSSWFDPSTWGTKVGNAGKFLAVSALSGAGSLYDSAATVANWAGADIKIADTAEWITSLDDDLGAYYGENRQAADVAGFVMSSFIPGLAGVKLLNAGQKALRAATSAGKVGSNLARYTGLLAPKAESYVALASAEIKSSQAVFSTLNSNTVKAIGSGVWQNVLEGTAFEIAAQAANFKSPVLEDQDSWGLAKNIAMGGALGGAIGGAFFSLKAINKIKLARVEEDILLKSQTGRELIQESTKPSDRIILAAENRTNTAEFTLLELPANATTEERLVRENRLINGKKATEDKFNKINLDTRTNLHEMSKDATTELVNHTADFLHNINVNGAVSALAHSVELTHPAIITKAEKAESLVSRYITIAGEGAGRNAHELPEVLDAATRLIPAKGSSISKTVMAAVNKSGFSLSKLFNPLADLNKLSYETADLRHVWMNELKTIPDNIVMHENDIPFLERMLKDGRTNFSLISVSKSAEKIAFKDTASLKSFIVDKKQAMADTLIEARIANGLENANAQTSIQAISKQLNVSERFLNGDVNINALEKDMFHWQSISDIHHAQLIEKGIKQQNSPVIPSYFIPKVVKVNYKLPADLDANGHIADALVHIKAQQNIFKQDVDRVFVKQAGDVFNNRAADLTAEQLAKTNSFGAGAGFLKSAQGGYATPEATVQALGSLTKDLKLTKIQQVTDTLASHVLALKSNKSAAIEFETLQQKLSRTTETYTFDSANILGQGNDAVVSIKYLTAAIKAADTGSDFIKPALQEGAEAVFKIENAETREALKAHLSLTKESTVSARERYAVLGKMHNFDETVIRPIRPSSTDYKHFAFVEDPRVTGAGHSTMLFANSEKELSDLITKTEQNFPEFIVRKKSDTAAWFKANQNYEYSLGLNENYIDSAMKSKGVYSNFYTRSNPEEIVSSLLNHHVNGARLEAMDLMRMKYNAEFNYLEQQAGKYSEIEASKFGSSKLESIAQTEKNPYISYVKTALDISSSAKDSPWKSLNTFLDTQVSKAVGRINQTYDAAKSVDDLDEVNRLMKHYGSNTAFANSAELALVNHSAPKAELSKFISKANAIMGRLTLGLDPLNAVNNFVGANILRMTELNSVVRRPEFSGIIKIPGVDSSILSPTKLLANAHARRWQNPELMKDYLDAGIQISRVKQFTLGLDELALKGTESVVELQNKTSSVFNSFKSLAEKGERLTGNKFAEEYNRFLSADVIRQITDVHETAGLMTRKESIVHWNTFVNRVEGSSSASQRPGVFQGPIGQAIGLFQSYQFNLIQQVFRHVAEGQTKDVAMFLGLQGTLYGLQGEPGFKLMNEHLIGTNSANPKHRDTYDFVRGAVGKEAGDWILYGAASNILQTNLYSRGDINPRYLTVLPTSIDEVPFVGGMNKVFSSMFEAGAKITNGGDVVESIRQGIEHNGISRPLAGLAQVSRGLGEGDDVFSTSKKGTIVGANDLMSWASVVRLAGGKPLDEAMLTDRVYGITAYEAADRKKKKDLAETIKSTVIGNNNQPDENSVEQFAAAYAKLGGKQSSFNKYMMEQYTKANTSQASIISSNLKSPMSYKIQQLMGGNNEQ